MADAPPPKKGRLTLYEDLLSPEVLAERRAQEEAAKAAEAKKKRDALLMFKPTNLGKKNNKNITKPKAKPVFHKLSSSTSTTISAPPTVAATSSPEKQDASSTPQQQQPPQQSDQPSSSAQKPAQKRGFNDWLANEDEEWMYSSKPNNPSRNKKKKKNKEAGVQWSWTDTYDPHTPVSFLDYPRSEVQYGLDEAWKQRLYDARKKLKLRQERDAKREEKRAAKNMQSAPPASFAPPPAFAPQATAAISTQQPPALPRQAPSARDLQSSSTKPPRGNERYYGPGQRGYWKTPEGMAAALDKTGPYIGPPDSSDPIYSLYPEDQTYLYDRSPYPPIGLEEPTTQNPQAEASSSRPSSRGSPGIHIPGRPSIPPILPAQSAGSASPLSAQPANPVPAQPARRSSPVPSVLAPGAASFSSIPGLQAIAASSRPGSRPQQPPSAPPPPVPAEDDAAAKAAKVAAQIAAIKAKMAAVKGGTDAPSPPASDLPNNATAGQAVPPPPPTSSVPPPEVSQPGVISAAPTFNPEYAALKARLEAVEAMEKTVMAPQDPDVPRSNRPGQAGFAERMLKKMGWEEGKGLGASGEGITTAIVAQAEKRKKKSDAEGGGYVTPANMGKIVGGKKAKPTTTEDDSNDAFGPMSEVIKLEDILANMDVDKEIQENNILQEIGDEMGEFGKVERLFIWRDTAGGHNEVFVKFTSQLSALRAVREMDGVEFAENKVKAKFWDAEKFERGEYE